MASRPTAADIFRKTANWVASHPIDYESLASGPAGEALTRAEIMEMADDQEAIDAFVAGLREMADRALSSPRLDQTGETDA